MSRFTDAGGKLYRGEVSYDFVGHGDAGTPSRRRSCSSRSAR